MGYTHYWRYRTEDLPVLERATESAARDLALLLPHLPPLAGPMGEGSPLLTEDLIAFNGPTPEDYESFLFSPYEPEYLEGDGVFGFVKTGPDYHGRRPYDLAAMVALTLLRWHAGEALRVDSDGNLLAWAPATGLVVQRLGYPVDPYFVLERELWLLADRRGGQFLVEAHRGEDPDGLLKHLAELHAHGYLPHPSPYRILAREVSPEGFKAHPRVSGIWLPAPKGLHLEEGEGA